MGMGVAATLFSVLSLVFVLRRCSERHPDLNFAASFSMIALAVLLSTRFAMSDPGLNAVNITAAYSGAVALLLFGTIKVRRDWRRVKRMLLEDRRSLDHLVQRQTHQLH